VLFFQVDVLERDTLELLGLVRSVKSSLAPISRIPSDVFSLVPGYWEGDDVDENLITMTQSNCPVPGHFVLLGNQILVVKDYYFPTVTSSINSPPYCILHRMKDLRTLTESVHQPTTHYPRLESQLQPTKAYFMSQLGGAHSLCREAK